MTDAEKDRLRAIAIRKNIRNKVAKERLAMAKAATALRGDRGFGGGEIIDYGPKSHGRRRTVRFGLRMTKGNVYHDPALTLARKLNYALTAPSRSSTCIVYDAQGVPIAKIDPITRERTAL